MSRNILQLTMAPVRTRSPSPVASNKRIKAYAPPHDTLEAVKHFASGIFEPGKAEELHKLYINSEPYKYCVLEKLFDDGLLRKVKDECIERLSFSEKSTDIYRVRIRDKLLHTCLSKDHRRSTKPETLPHFPIFQRSNCPSFHLS